MRNAAKAAGLVAIATLVGVAGCKRKDEEKCQQAQATVRDALQKEDFDSAKQWREYAYKHCADGLVLSNLDQEIVAKQKEIAERKAREEAEKQKMQQLVKALVDFTSQNRNDPKRAGAGGTCEPVDPDKEKGDQVCTARRSFVGQPYSIDVKYYAPKDAEKIEAFRYAMNIDGKVTCNDVGTNTELRKWGFKTPTGSVGNRYHCDLTAGPLQGLRVIVGQMDTKSLVEIYSPKFRDMDRDLRGRAKM